MSRFSRCRPIGSVESQGLGDAAPTPSSGGRPWWLEEEVQCGFCLGLHAITFSARCVACDAEACSRCIIVTRETAETWCPTCDPLRPAGATDLESGAGDD